jgi:hypothetical protein
MHLRFFHVFPWLAGSFIFIIIRYPLYHTLFIYSPIEGDLLVIMNKVAVNIHVIFLCGCKFPAHLDKCQKQLLDHMVIVCLVL